MLKSQAHSCSNIMPIGKIPLIPHLQERKTHLMQLSISSPTMLWMQLPGKNMLWVFPFLCNLPSLLSINMTLEIVS